MGIGYSVLINLVFMQRDCDWRLVTFLLLLDFSKAFDNVQHSLLLRKLSLYFQFGGTAVALCVSVGEILSELIVVTRDVMQGPLLFSIFFNERRRCAAVSE
jgi:hypothetical protein